ncbi:MAG TPA: hypothetical protein DEB17_05750 [Chlorobaculum sp.]|uniref:Uncharacterized protein n=1 Tax=Chlorobaculum tepidum (strain ATCC 49652 / DSM 12025 / NBRC 103806 / TLS) TaxID=194439 RepID=Q8KF24_CHLTE|nr:hypothetical protein CT0508 [Chlorobaculum tepidum TLS]HBU23489.1 hypothetical protein [Chlorobaculum sp.]
MLYGYGYEHPGFLDCGKLKERPLSMRGLSFYI